MKKQEEKRRKKQEESRRNNIKERRNNKNWEEMRGKKHKKKKRKQESKLPTDATYNISLIFKLIIFKDVFDIDTIPALYAFPNINSLNGLT